MGRPQPRRKRGRKPAPKQGVASRGAPKPRARHNSRRGPGYIGRNSGGPGAAPERTVRDDARPPGKPRLSGRMAGEAPNPSRRLGSVAPVERPAPETPDRTYVRYELVVPDMAKQLISQADRIRQPQAGLLAGWASAATAADLCYWRVRRSSIEEAGTRDVSALDAMFDPREIERTVRGEIIRARRR